MARIKRLSVTVGLAIAVSCAAAQAQRVDTYNVVKIGYADIRFNTDSGDLSGPAGTTPSGIKTDLNDTRTLALIYERKISGPWAVVVQTGLPPMITIDGADTAKAVGRIGSARAWFPAILVKYTFPEVLGFRPFLGAGVNYAFYTDRHMTDAYTNAFSASRSSVKLQNSWGPVVKLGAEFPIGENWLIDLSYSHYWIKTEAHITSETPGLGQIERTIKVNANPDAFGLLVGYRF